MLQTSSILLPSCSASLTKEVIWTETSLEAFSAATKSTQHSPRQIRHLDFVSQFTSDIRHVKGAENPVADALSRIELNGLAQHQGIDFEDMAKAQASDPDLTQFQQSSSSLYSSRLFTYRRQPKLSSAISRLEHHDHSSLMHSGDLCSMPFIHFRTLASGPRNA